MSALSRYLDISNFLPDFYQGELRLPFEEEGCFWIKENCVSLHFHNSNVIQEIRVGPIDAVIRLVKQLFEKTNFKITLPHQIVRTPKTQQIRLVFNEKGDVSVFFTFILPLFFRHNSQNWKEVETNAVALQGHALDESFLNRISPSCEHLREDVLKVCWLMEEKGSLYLFQKRTGEKEGHKLDLVWLNEEQREAALSYLNQASTLPHFIQVFCKIYTLRRRKQINVTFIDLIYYDLRPWI